MLLMIQDVECYVNAKPAVCCRMHVRPHAFSTVIRGWQCLIASVWDMLYHQHSEIQLF